MAKKNQGRNEPKISDLLLEKERESTRQKAVLLDSFSDSLEAIRSEIQELAKKRESLVELGLTTKLLAESFEMSATERKILRTVIDRPSTDDTEVTTEPAENHVF